MKRTLLLLSIIINSFVFGQLLPCNELFISEYVEGWSTNKALEIYNPTNNPIDLSQYMVIRYSNGATSATSANAIQLTGTIAPYDVHVGVLEKLDPNGTGQEAPIWDSLQVRADAFYCPVYDVSNAFYWNGNDAIALAKGVISDIPNSLLVDVFGKIGENPGDGWTSAFPYVGTNGDIVTEDHSLIRKPTILKGENNPTISYFNPLAEYDSIPPVVDIGGQLYGNWFSLGSHDCDCAPASLEDMNTDLISITPNPSNGSFNLKGISSYSSILVVNSLGQKIKLIEGNFSDSLLLDLDESKGVYFLRLKDNSGNRLTKRVIIK